MPASSTLQRTVEAAVVSNCSRAFTVGVGFVDPARISVIVVSDSAHFDEPPTDVPSRGVGDLPAIHTSARQIGATA
jgi:hypothetical protein